MPAVNERLAKSLEELRRLQQDGSRVFTSSQFARGTRERLIRNGFLLEVIRGWLISSNPASGPGDTTPWFSSFWDFCSRYCNDRFGEAWYLSPEQSLLLHAENAVIPRQVLIHSPAGNNSAVQLLFGTSLFVLKVRDTPAPRDLVFKNGLRIHTVPAALVRVTEAFFRQHPLEAKIILGAIRDSSELLTRLLEGGHSTIAGRLTGAFRFLGEHTIADDIAATMRAADHVVRESNPFDPEEAFPPPLKAAPAIVSRLHAMWAAGREAVVDVFSSLRRPVASPSEYLQTLDDVYTLDAYHSLSIEGYQVTPELIQRVATGVWDPELSETDREGRNALAARGYWLAFSRVRELVKQTLTTASPPDVRAGHREWYRELFAPHVNAGLLPATALAGYRNAPVYLRGSRHVPPRWELLAEAMPALFDLIAEEPETPARAVLAHWLFGYVHPYPDGNGRIARFLMNVLFASGGYPWTVIRVEERSEYLHALEAASVDGDVRPFATFVLSQMRKTQADVRRRASLRARRAPRGSRKR